MLELKEDNQQPDLAEMYFFALKSPVTRDKYKRRLENFFNFIGIEGESFQDKCNNFFNQSKLKGDEWVFSVVLKFLKFHLERVNRKEITGSTIQKLRQKHKNI